MQKGGVSTHQIKFRGYAAVIGQLRIKGDSCSVAQPRGDAGGGREGVRLLLVQALYVGFSMAHS